MADGGFLSMKLEHRIQHFDQAGYSFALSHLRDIYD